MIRHLSHIRVTMRATHYSTTSVTSAAVDTSRSLIPEFFALEENHLSSSRGLSLVIHEVRYAKDGRGSYASVVSAPKFG